MNRRFVWFIIFAGISLIFPGSVLPQYSGKTTQKITEDSPFGIHPAVPFEDAEYLGVKWTRGINDPYLFWFLVDPGITGDVSQFRWKAGEFNYDSLFSANRAGLNILYNIEVEPRPISHGKRNSWLPQDEEAYKSFVREAVKRYSFVKYWQVGNEPIYNKMVSDYGKFVAITYEAIKEANPRAKVLLGGVAGLGMS